MDPFIDDLCDFAEPDFRDHGLSLVRELNFEGALRLNEVKSQRALYNIMSNALDAMQSGGSLTVATSCSGGTVEVGLTDTGPGIPEEIKDSLFEPFVTHDKARGPGLGLAIAKKTIRDHGGTISVHSFAGHGATFIIRLPLE